MKLFVLASEHLLIFIFPFPSSFFYFPIFYSPISQFSHFFLFPIKPHYKAFILLHFHAQRSQQALLRFIKGQVLINKLFQRKDFIHLLWNSLLWCQNTSLLTFFRFRLHFLIFPFSTLPFLNFPIVPFFTFPIKNTLQSLYLTIFSRSRISASTTQVTKGQVLINKLFQRKYLIHL